MFFMIIFFFMSYWLVAAKNQHRKKSISLLGIMQFADFVQASVWKDYQLNYCHK